MASQEAPDGQVMDKFDEKARERFPCTCDICNTHRRQAAELMRDVAKETREADIESLQSKASLRSSNKCRWCHGEYGHSFDCAITFLKEVMPTDPANAGTSVTPPGVESGSGQPNPDDEWVREKAAQEDSSMVSAGKLEGSGHECAARKALQTLVDDIRHESEGVTRYQVPLPSVMAIADAALAQPCPAPQSSLTREQLDVAKEIGRLAAEAGIPIIRLDSADDWKRAVAEVKKHALQSVAGSEDTRLCWDIQKKIEEAHAEICKPAYRMPMWVGGRLWDCVMRLRGARAAIESEGK